MIYLITHVTPDNDEILGYHTDRVVAQGVCREHLENNSRPMYNEMTIDWEGTDHRFVGRVRADEIYFSDRYVIRIIQKVQ